MKGLRFEVDPLNVEGNRGTPKGSVVNSVGPLCMKRDTSTLIPGRGGGRTVELLPSLVQVK